MANIMDFLHLNGVAFIKIMQDDICKDCGDLMQFITGLGDPGSAFTLYFPLCYICLPAVGIKVMWVAAISEWLNAVLKWILHGERPYWWVHETALYDKALSIQQFSHTCETGPGSPSGHAMVTASVFYVMLSGFTTYKFAKFKHRQGLTALVWMMFGIFMLAVCVSRCYISAHFPHQVVAGTITGVILGALCDRIPTSSMNTRQYMLASMFMLISGFATYVTLLVAGFDPLWSVAKAQKWCAHKHWIHLNTTLFSALVRDGGALIGLGMALNFDSNNTEDQEKEVIDTDTVVSTMYYVVAVLLSWFITLGSGHIPLPIQPTSLFYMLYFLKNILMPFIIVKFIPDICASILSILGFDRKNKIR